MGTTTRERTTAHLAAFLTDCVAQGMAERTIKWYQGLLTPFARTFTQLPSNWVEISEWLRRHRDGADRRGSYFRAVQAFYAFLDRTGAVSPSPVPRGKVGRPSRKISQEGGGQAPISDNKLVSRAQDGAPAAPPVHMLTIARAQELFMARVAAMGLRDSTVGDYEGFFRRIREGWEFLPTTPEPIDQFIGSLKTVSPERRFSYWRMLKTLYIFLNKRLGFPNPIPNTSRPRVPRKVRPTLSMEECQKVLQADLCPRDRAMVALLFTNGIRAGELCSLDAENVKDCFITVDGKTGQRVVPITRDLQEILLTLSPTGPIFKGSRGRLTVSGVYQILRPILEGLGINHRHMGPQLLRHTFAQKFLQAGGDIVSLQETLGHKQIGTTAIYGHQDMASVQRKVEQLSLFGRSQKEGK